MNSTLELEFLELKRQVLCIDASALILTQVKDVDAPVFTGSGEVVKSLSARFEQLRNDYRLVRMSLVELVQLEKALLETFVRDDFVLAVAQMNRKEIGIMLAPLSEQQRLFTEGLLLLKQNELEISLQTYVLEADSRIEEGRLEDELKKTHAQFQRNLQIRNKTLDQPPEEYFVFVILFCFALAGGTFWCCLKWPKFVSVCLFTSLVLLTLVWHFVSDWAENNWQ